MKTIKRSYRIAGLLLAALLQVSCNQELAEPIAGNDEPVRLALQTEGLEDGMTFRIMIYHAGVEYPDRIYGFYESGTYWLENKTDEELKRCTLNENGTWTGNEGDGLNGVDGYYFIFFVSPGVKSNDDGSFDFVPTDDKPSGEQPAFRISASAREQLLGTYGLHRIETKLYDKRAKVGFNFYKNQKLKEDISIKELQLFGAGADGETVKLYPATEQVVVNPKGGIAIELEDKKSENTTDDEGNTLCYSTPETEKATIASAIYAPREEVAEHFKVAPNDHFKESGYLSMKCLLTQGERKDMPVEMVLTAKYPKLEAQHEYMFNITVSSTYITATLDVYDLSGSDNAWQDGGSDDIEITKPNYTVKLGTWEVAGDGEDGWDLVEIEDQVIGDSKQ